MGLRHHLHARITRHRPPVTHSEVRADAIFFLVGAFLALTAVFIFDIHWSFYPQPGHHIFPPSHYIFNSPVPYILGGLLGGILGIFITKLLLLGIRQEGLTIVAPSPKRRRKK